MANSFNAGTEIVLRQLLVALDRHPMVPMLFNRSVVRTYDQIPQINTDVRIAQPIDPTIKAITDGQFNPTDIEQSYVTFKLDQSGTFEAKLKDLEFTFDIDRMNEMLVEPAMAKIVSRMNTLSCTKLLDLPMLPTNTSTPPNIPTTTSDISKFISIGQRNNVNMLGSQAVVLIGNTLYEQLWSIPTFEKANESGSVNDFGLESFMWRGIRYLYTNAYDESTHTSGTIATAQIDNALATSNLVQSTTLVLKTTNVATGTILAGDKLRIVDPVITAGFYYVTVAANATAAANAITVTIKEPLKHKMTADAAVTVYDGGGNASKSIGTFLTLNDTMMFAAPNVKSPFDNSPHIDRVKFKLMSGGRDQSFEDQDGFWFRVIKGQGSDIRSTNMAIDSIWGSAVRNSRSGFNFLVRA